MAASAPQPQSFQFENLGLDIRREPSTLKPGEYPELTNFTSTQEGALTLRAGQQRLSSALSFNAEAIIHTITKMKMNAAQDARYFGAAGSIYRTTQALPASGAGLNGAQVAQNCAPVSLGQPYTRQRFGAALFNAGATGSPYEYFACPSKMLKDNGQLNSGDGTGDGTIIQKWGILRPGQPAIAALDAITLVPNSDVVAPVQTGTRFSTTVNGTPAQPSGATSGAGYYNVPVVDSSGIMVGALVAVGVQVAIVLNTTTAQFSAYFTVAPTNGQTVTSTERAQTLDPSGSSPSSGNSLFEFNLGATVSAAFDGIAPDYNTPDVVHVAIGVSQPSLISDLRLRVILGSYSSTPSDYYEKSITISSAQPVVNLSQTATTALTTLAPQAASGIVGDFVPIDPLSQDLKPGTLEPIPPSQPSGTPVFTEVDFLKSDFVAVGRAGTGDFTWQNVVGFQFVALSNVSVGMPQVWVSSIYIAGGYGPNAVTANPSTPLAPYSYLYCYQNLFTGTISNPSALMIPNNFVSPGRQRVSVTLQGSGDEQVTSIVIYRSGGAFSDGLYRQLGTISNPGANTNTVYLDNQPDSSLLSAPLIEFDNDVPVTSTLPQSYNMTFNGFNSGGGAMQTCVFRVGFSPSGGLLALNIIKAGTLITIAKGTPKEEQIVVAAVSPSIPQSTITAFFQYSHNGGDPSKGDFVPGVFPNPGTTVAQVSSTANQPCTLAVSAFDSVFVAGDPNNPHVVYKSKTGRPEAFPVVTLASGIPGSAIVGSPSNPIINFTEWNGGLLFLNLKNLYFMYVAYGAMEAPIETPAQRGLYSTWAWCKADNEIWYLSYDGIYSWSGGVSQKRSEPIDPLFRGIPVGNYNAIDMRPGLGNQGSDVITMAFNKNTVYMEYMDTAGNWFRAEYDTIYNRWYIHQTNDPIGNNMPVTAQYAERDTGNLLLAKSSIFSTVAYVYLYGVGTSDGWVNTPTDGSPIAFAVTTAGYTMGAPALNKQYLDAVLELLNDNITQITWQVFYDFSATMDPVDNGTISQPSPPQARHRIPFSFQAGYGKEAYACQFRFSGSTTASLSFYSLTFNVIPLQLVQAGRTWDWDDLGWSGDKRLYQIFITYDIPLGTIGTLYLDTITGIAGSQTENVATQTFTLTGPVGQGASGPVRITSNFALNDVMIVKKVRVRPASTNPTGSTITSNPFLFKYFEYNFGDFERLPPDKVLFTPWNNYGSDYDKYAQQIDLDVDTGGVVGTTSLQADGVTVAGPFNVTTTSENRHYNITLPPNIKGKQFRLLNTAGVGGKFQLYGHQIITLPADRGPVLQTFDWSYLGWPYDKKLKHVTIEYDTTNAPTTIQMDTMTGIKGGTINTAVQLLVLDQPGRALQTFAFPDGLYVKQVRLFPVADNVVFKEWKPTWDVDNYPPDITEFTDWSDLGWPCEKILRSLEIEMDTGGVPATIQIQGDGANLGAPITITTTATDRRRIITLPSDLVAKNVRLTFTPGTNGKTQYFTHSFEAIREPCAVSHWDSYETNFQYDGYSFIKQCWLQYVCPSPVTVSFYSDGGILFFQALLPAHALRDVERFYLPSLQFTNGNPVLNKSKRHRIQVDSASPFKFYPDVSRIEWQPLGIAQRQGYQQLNFSAITAINTGFGTIEGADSEPKAPAITSQLVGM